VKWFLKGQASIKMDAKLIQGKTSLAILINMQGAFISTAVEATVAVKVTAATATAAKASASAEAAALAEEVRV
jgi:hypothetical protein